MSFACTTRFPDTHCGEIKAHDRGRKGIHLSVRSAHMQVYLLEAHGPMRLIDICFRLMLLLPCSQTQENQMQGRQRRKGKEKNTTHHSCGFVCGRTGIRDVLAQVFRQTLRLSEPTINYLFSCRVSLRKLPIRSCSEIHKTHSWSHSLSDCAHTCKIEVCSGTAYIPIRSFASDQ
jgi:hypothetical protein